MPDVLGSCSIQVSITDTSVDKEGGVKDECEARVYEIDMQALQASKDKIDHLLRKLRRAAHFANDGDYDQFGHSLPGSEMPGWPNTFEADFYRNEYLDSLSDSEDGGYDAG